MAVQPAPRTTLGTVLRTVNAVAGGILMASGAITAYADTFGPGSRWVSAFLGGLGVVQLVSADVMTSLERS